MKRILQIAYLVFIWFISYAQDPGYHDFVQNRNLFNPSLTGSYGTQSWKLRSKFQWNNDGGTGYKTVSLLAEETMPCSILDIGFKLNYNEEGRGSYNTLETGLLSAIFLPYTTSKFSDHNIKFGLDFSWGINSINYSKLIWSDQLDPKYGIIYPTGFVPPNDGKSAIYFNPGFGVSLRSIWNKKSSKALMTNFGIAMYRFYSFYGGEINQSVSVLGLKSPNPHRITAFFETEFLPYYHAGKFIGVRPVIMYQKQGTIDYFELGVHSSYLRSAGLGFYYHTAPGNASGVTPWITISTDFLIPVGRGKKMELNFSWSENMGGLQNFVGPQLEVGISFHFAKSSICNLLRLEDDVPYNYDYKCPIMSISPGKRKMYENIWYK